MWISQHLADTYNVWWDYLLVGQTYGTFAKEWIMQGTRRCIQSVKSFGTLIQTGKSKINPLIQLWCSWKDTVNHDKWITYSRTSKIHSEFYFEIRWMSLVVSSFQILPFNLFSSSFNPSQSCWFRRTLFLLHPECPRFHKTFTVALLHHHTNAFSGYF